MNEHGNKSEKRVAKKLGMKQTPASGALPGAKGDMKNSEYLMEAKSTINSSMQLQKGWLDKIQKEAMAINRVPAVTISFVVGSGAAKLLGDWVMVPSWFWEELNSRGSR
jgi:hypothetical protein